MILQMKVTEVDSSGSLGGMGIATLQQVDGDAVLTGVSGTFIVDQVYTLTLESA